MEIVLILALLILGELVVKRPEIMPWAVALAAIMVSGRLFLRYLDHKLTRELKRIEANHKQAMADAVTVQAELKRPVLAKTATPQKTEEHHL